MKRIFLLSVLMFSVVVSVAADNPGSADKNKESQREAFARAAELLKSGNFVLVADYISWAGYQNISERWSGRPNPGMAFISVENGEAHVQTSNYGYHVSQGIVEKFDVEEKKNGNIIAKIRYFIHPTRTFDIIITLKKNQEKAVAQIWHLSMFGTIQDPNKTVLYPGKQIDYTQTLLGVKPADL